MCQCWSVDFSLWEKGWSKCPLLCLRFFLGSSAFALLLLVAVSRFAVFLVVLRFVACGAFACGAFAFGAGGDLGEGDDFFLPVRPGLGDASSLLACPA